MSAWLLVVSLLLAVVSGVLFLLAYLWYRHALRLHAETFFPDDATGIRLLRYGIAAGFATFGGFLFVFVFYLLAEGTASGPGGHPFTDVPFEEVSVGLFLLSLATFVVAGSGYAADAVRVWLRGVR